MITTTIANPADQRNAMMPANPGRTFLLGAASALALAAGADAATLQATPANLLAQVRAAQPGDVVRLASGTYSIGFTVQKPAPGITIEPAPGATVIASVLNLTGSTNITVDGVDVPMAGAGAYGATAGPGSQNITFRHLKVHQADNKTNDGVAFYIRGANAITVDSSEIGHSGIGINIIDTDHVVLTNNLIHDISGDDIDLAGAPYAKVIGNTAINNVPGPDEHPDFIQFWGTKTNPNPCDIVIEKNRYDRGKGGAAQGIFGEGGCNVTIANNIIRGAMGNGIALAFTNGANISGNFVQGYPDMASGMVVRNRCSNITMTNNAAGAVTNYVVAGEMPCTNVKISSTTIVKAAKFGDDAVLNKRLEAQQASAPAAP
jgi:hypothetical protein